MKWFWDWIDRVRPMPPPVVERREVFVNAPRMLVLEPNPRVRQQVVLSELGGLNKRDIERALELLHEYFLAEASLTMLPKGTDEPDLTIRIQDAPVYVIREMAALVARTDKPVNTREIDPKKGILNG